MVLVSPGWWGGCPVQAAALQEARALLEGSLDNRKDGRAVVPEYLAAVWEKPGVCLFFSGKGELAKYFWVKVLFRYINNLWVWFCFTLKWQGFGARDADGHWWRGRLTAQRRVREWGSSFQELMSEKLGKKKYFIISHLEQSLKKREHQLHKISWSIKIFYMLQVLQMVLRSKNTLYLFAKYQSAH